MSETDRGVCYSKKYMNQIILLKEKKKNYDRQKKNVFAW